MGNLFLVSCLGLFFKIDPFSMEIPAPIPAWSLSCQTRLGNTRIGILEQDVSISTHPLGRDWLAAALHFPDTWLVLYRGCGHRY